MTQAYGFRVRWSDADGGWFADFSEIPILTGFGATPEDAVAELRDVLRAVIDAWRARTEPAAPAPAGEGDGERASLRDHRRRDGCGPRRH